MYNTYLYNTPLYNTTSQPSILFHYLFDGSYCVKALSNNRIVVVGQSNTGAPAQGEDEDAAEIALVGERLDMKPNPLATTSTTAAQLASAALDKQRLKGKDGFVSLPPHCGMELYDVIKIQDSLCSQEATSFRVLGIRLTYDPTTPHPYMQQLTLGAV